MTDRRSQRELDRQIMAYADGELDAPASQDLLRRMAQDSDLARRVLHQQQLRQAVAKSVGDVAPAAPDALRRAVSAMGPAEASAPRPLARIGAGASDRQAGLAGGVWWSRWAPAAVAALLLISTLAALYFRPSPPVHSPAGSGAALLTVSDVQRFAGRHVTCAKAIQRLHNRAKFAESIEQLPGDIGRYLGCGPCASLDLSGIGYEFRGAGECAVPGSPAVHLVYRAASGGEGAPSLSLWITPRNADLALEPGVMYRAGAEPATSAMQSAPGDLRPMLLWRQGDADYYLLADIPQALDEAAHQLARADGA